MDPCLHHGLLGFLGDHTFKFRKQREAKGRDAGEAALGPGVLSVNHDLPRKGLSRETVFVTPPKGTQRPKQRDRPDLVTRDRTACSDRLLRIPHKHH